MLPVFAVCRASHYAVVISDVNECETPGLALCQHSCRNSLGSFHCQCPPGHRLHPNGRNCTDINECHLHPPRCQHLCQNVMGSYHCTCPVGYQLLPDGKRCEDRNECTDGSHGCVHGCDNTAGSYQCTCEPGFRLREQGVCEGECARGGESARVRGVQEDGKGVAVSVDATCEPACAGGAAECVSGQCVCPPGLTGADCHTGCLYKGLVLEDEQTFSPEEDNCTLCLCLAGNITCLTPYCPPVTCEQPVQSECCPLCPAECVYQGNVYLEGAEFSRPGDDCTTCVCKNGEVECSYTPCPVLDCPRGDWRLEPGECCFSCHQATVERGCSVDDNGAEFPVGQIWSPGDPCETCMCQSGGMVVCRRTECLESCPHPILIPGQCCPDCSVGCSYSGVVYENNESFPSRLDPCLHCICLSGSVACSPAQCKPSCTYPFHQEGACCPVCQDCNYEGRKVLNGLSFTLESSPCTQCTCQFGEVSCEEIHCNTTCSHPYPLPGECCPTCQGKSNSIPALPVKSNSIPCPTCQACLYAGQAMEDGGYRTSESDPCIVCLCAVESTADLQDLKTTPTTTCSSQASRGTTASPAASESDHEGASVPGRGEAGRGEAGRREAGRGRTGRKEAGRGETGRKEAGRGQAGRGEAGRREAGRGETGRKEAGRGETERKEAGRGQAGRGEAGRRETGRGEAGRREAGRGEAGRGEAGRGETITPTPVRLGLSALLKIRGMDTAPTPTSATLLESSSPTGNLRALTTSDPPTTSAQWVTPAFITTDPETTAPSSQGTPTALTLATPTLRTVTTPTALTLATPTLRTVTTPTALTLATPTLRTVTTPTALTLATPTLRATPLTVSTPSNHSHSSDTGHSHTQDCNHSHSSDTGHSHTQDCNHSHSSDTGHAHT
ncbi:UNVERIFIED_CONTAM: hypothetical protein FKN15_022242 [Acipenser sinensis]